MEKREYNDKKNKFVCFNSAHLRDAELNKMKKNDGKLPKNVYFGQYKNIEGEMVYFINRKL